MSMNLNDPKTRQLIQVINAMAAAGSSFTLPEVTHSKHATSMNRLSQKGRRRRHRQQLARGKR